MSNPYGSLPGVVGEFLDVPFVYRKICDVLPTPEVREAEDSLAFWFEFGFTAPSELVGDSAAGWLDAAGEISWKIQSSDDLLTWADDEMIDCATTAIDNLNGTFTYWSRRVVPRLWKAVMIDLTVGTDRHGKSITGLEIFGVAVPDLNYPYAMPSQAATLQTDLRAAGYTGAVVSTSSGTLVAKAKNHVSTGTVGLVVTMSGNNVEAVNFYGGGAISLPSYPYTMPGSRASLQTDLRANGAPGAVVMLYKDPWSIFLPDRDASANARSIVLTISPGDPFPAYDFYGVYQGEAPANVELGTPSNTRSPLGAPLLESVRAFFRVCRLSLPI